MPGQLEHGGKNAGYTALYLARSLEEIWDHIGTQLEEDRYLIVSRARTSPSQRLFYLVISLIQPQPCALAFHRKQAEFAFILVNRGPNARAFSVDFVHCRGV